MCWCIRTYLSSLQRSTYMHSTESMSVATIIGVSAGGAIFAVVAIVVLFLCGKCVCIKEVSFFLYEIRVYTYLCFFMCATYKACV